MGRHKGKRPLGIPWGRWEDNNIKINSNVWYEKARTGLIFFTIGTDAGLL